MEHSILTEIKLDPVTGKKLKRDVRPYEVKYKNLIKIISMPGWYPMEDDEGIFTPQDMDIYSEALNQLKAQYIASLKENARANGAVRGLGRPSIYGCVQ